MPADWLIGVLLSIVGAAVDNFGVTLQKYSHMVNERVPQDKRRPYVKQRIWMLGLLLFLLGNGFNVIGLSFAPQTLFAALGAVSFVANSVNAYFFLGEAFTIRALVATVIVVTGSTLAVIFGAHEDQDYTLDDFLTYFDTNFMYYAVVLLLLLLALGIAVALLQRRKTTSDFNRRRSFSQGALVLSLEQAEPLVVGEAEILLDVDYDQLNSATGSPLPAAAAELSAGGSAGAASTDDHRYQPLDWQHSSQAHRVPAAGGDLSRSPQVMDAADFKSPPHRERTIGAHTMVSPVASSTATAVGSVDAASPAPAVAPGKATRAVSPGTASKLRRWMFSRGRQRSDSLINTEALLAKPELPTPISRRSGMSRHRKQRFLSLAFPAFAGLVGSITVLLAKAAALVVRQVFRPSGEHNAFEKPLPYLIIFATIVCGCVQLHWLNLGLRKYDQLIVIPAYLVCYTTFSILGGAFYFREFESYSTEGYIFFPLGTLMTFLGVYVLATRPSPPTTDIASFKPRCWGFIVCFDPLSEYAYTGHMESNQQDQDADDDNDGDVDGHGAGAGAHAASHGPSSGDDEAQPYYQAGRLDIAQPKGSAGAGPYAGQYDDADRHHYFVPQDRGRKGRSREYHTITASGDDRGTNSSRVRPHGHRSGRSAAGASRAAIIDRTAPVPAESVSAAASVDPVTQQLRTFGEYGADHPPVAVTDPALAASIMNRALASSAVNVSASSNMPESSSAGGGSRTARH